MDGVIWSPHFNIFWHDCMDTCCEKNTHVFCWQTPVQGHPYCSMKGLVVTVLTWISDLSNNSLCATVNSISDRTLFNSLKSLSFNCRMYFYLIVIIPFPLPIKIIIIKHFIFRDSLVAQRVKNLPAMQKTQVWSRGQEDPLEKRMTTHAVFLPGDFHGQRSLVG